MNFYRAVCYYNLVVRILDRVVFCLRAVDPQAPSSPMEESNSQPSRQSPRKLVKSVGSCYRCSFSPSSAHLRYSGPQRHQTFSLLLPYRLCQNQAH